MYDRIPSPGKENRVRITQDNGQVLEGVLSYADDATQEGTPWTKATVMDDVTAFAFGFTEEEAVPNNAFLQLYLQLYKVAMAKVTVTVGGQPAAAGIEIVGLNDIEGKPIYTDDTGTAIGFVAEDETALSTVDYEDLPSVSVPISPVQGELLQASITLGTPAAGVKTLTSSKSGIRFSPYVTSVDVSAAGGGGGGGGGVNYQTEGSSSRATMYAGSGGKSGDIVTQKGIAPDTKTAYAAVIGAGGKGGNRTNQQTKDDGATSGGNSSFMGVVAAGGAPDYEGGGVYNNRNNTYIEPKDGSAGGYLFGEVNQENYVGGGGGGAPVTNRIAPRAYGGDPYGGDGGYAVQGSGAWVNPTAGGTAAGGGGGSYGHPGADGGPGVVKYRWEVAA